MCSMCLISEQNIIASTSALYDGYVQQIKDEYVQQIKDEYVQQIKDE